MLPLLLLVVGAAVSQEVTKPLTKEEIKALSAKGDIPVSKALRCGLFFAEDDFKKPPLNTMFVFNRTMPLPSPWSCPTTNKRIFRKGKDELKKFIDVCKNIWLGIESHIVYTKGSIYKDRKAKGLTLGDDICIVLKDTHKVPDVPFQKGGRTWYQNGLKFGMFTNICENKKWIDNRVRIKEGICCKDGRHIPC